MAFMLLAGVANPERLRHQSPGEWGRLLGLDRCPGPDVLRRKIAALADPPDAVRDWLLALASYWHAVDIEVQAELFFDGRDKVYTGRHRLTATTGFWANTPGGVPLLALPHEVNPGPRRVLWQDLLPELKRMGLASPPGGADADAGP